MQIRELVRASGVPAKTIRYYESIGLLPPPERAINNYRSYHPADVERVRFIASARSLGVSLGEIAEILAARDQGIAPCDRVLGVLAERLSQLDRHIADRLALRADLHQIHAVGAELPRDDFAGGEVTPHRVDRAGDPHRLSRRRSPGGRRTSRSCRTRCGAVSPRRSWGTWSGTGRRAASSTRGAGASWLAGSVAWGLPSWLCSCVGWCRRGTARARARARAPRGRPSGDPQPPPQVRSRSARRRTRRAARRGCTRAPRRSGSWGPAAVRAARRRARAAPGR